MLDDDGDNMEMETEGGDDEDDEINEKDEDGRVEVISEEEVEILDGGGAEDENRVVSDDIGEAELAELGATSKGKASQGGARGRSMKGKEGTVSVVKGYKAQQPKLSKRGETAQAATDMLNSVAGYFSPDQVRQRDEGRTMQFLYGRAQAENQELRDTIRSQQSRIDTLQDRLLHETRRADQAETELRFFRMMKQSRYRSHRSPSPYRHSYTNQEYANNPGPSLRCRSSRSRSPRHRHQVSRSPDLYTADTGTQQTSSGTFDYFNNVTG